jgi:hypothetical protein
MIEEDMRIERLALIAFSISWLGACAPSQQQEFVVSAVPSNQSAALFASADAGLDDAKARQICVLGYEKLGEQTLPADPGTFDTWRVRCAPHTTWFLPEF